MIGLLSALVLAGAPQPRIDQVPGKSGRHALLIGVQYNDVRLRLHTEPDVQAMKATLTSEKYAFQDVQCLDTEVTTSYQQIKEGFAQLAKRVKAGDTVVVFYSGHGSQLPDDNGDETDGYDETLVPGDYSRNAPLAQIRDDEIGTWLDAIWAKRPKSVVAIFDSCHSGTATRDGVALERHLPPEFIEHAPSKPAIAVTHTSEMQRHPTITLSACSPEETAKETTRGDSMGAFTWALTRVLNDSAVSDKTTVSALMERAGQYLHEQNRSQTPIYDGDPGTVFMSGEIRPSKPYLAVDGLVLQGGRLVGVSKGSVYGLYPAGTDSPEPNSKICEAEVVGTPGLYTSALRLLNAEKKHFVEAANGLRAFLISASFDNVLKVAVDEALAKRSPDLESILRSSLRDIQVADQTLALANPARAKAGDYDLLLTSSPRGALEFLRSDGTPVKVKSPVDGTLGLSEYEFAASQNLAPLAREVIERESMVNFLRDIQNPSVSSDVSMEMRIVRVLAEDDPDHRGKRRFVAAKGTVSQSAGEATPQVKLGEEFAIQVRNSGKQALYVNVLEFDAGGETGLLWPPRDNPVEGNTSFKPALPQAGEDGWTYLKANGNPVVWKFGEPSGPDCFKLVATDRRVAMDFMRTREVPKDAPSSAFEKLFRMSVAGTRTADQLSDSGAEVWCTQKTIVRITE